jgi:hypothetical protein
VGKYAPAALVAALLVATAAAFVVTEKLKLTPSPILGTRVDKLFSPVCDCSTNSATIRFRLRRSDRVGIEIIRGGHDVVRRLIVDQAAPRGLFSAVWDGRDDAGQVVPDGTYRPRVRLSRQRRTIVLPNPIQVDTKPPQVEIAIAPTVFSPDGDGRADRVLVTYHTSEPARVSLYVDGVRRALKRGSKADGVVPWSGRVSGKALPTGAYALSIGVEDLAGNGGLRTGPRQVVLRFIALGRKRIVAGAGRRFALFVSADSKLVEWHLAGRVGTAKPGTLHLRAPKAPGRYTLVVREHGHAARAAVIVRAAA